MGTQLSLNYLWKIAKNPVGPLIGFFCQFGIMPLVAYGLAKTILPSHDRALQFSLFAAGCSPGGGKSSFWTIIFGGNLDLSVSMTLTQTIGAMGMVTCNDYHHYPLFSYDAHMDLHSWFYFF